MSGQTDTTWKAFSQNDLTHSGAHYLMAIQELLEKQGYARLSDVAKTLNISKGSLSTSLKPLIKKQLILEDENKHLHLSEDGAAYARRIRNTDVVVEHFLSKILHVSAETAQVDACKIEHLLSPESTSEILKLIKVLEKDPELLKTLQTKIQKHKECSPNGCTNCDKDGFCLGK